MVNKGAQYDLTSVYYDLFESSLADDLEVNAYQTTLIS